MKLQEIIDFETLTPQEQHNAFLKSNLFKTIQGETIRLAGRRLTSKNKHLIDEIYQSFEEAFLAEDATPKALIYNYRKIMLTEFRAYTIEGGDGLREIEKEGIHTFVTRIIVKGIT